VSARDESLAGVYSSALLDLTFEKGVHAEVLAELREFRQVLEQEPKFADFLNAPNIRQQAKKDVLDRVFGGSVSDATLNFLKVVVDKRRQFWLPWIIDGYIEGYHERMGELVVKVETAVSLDEGQQGRLREALKQKFDKDIILEERVKPDLLGGLVLRVGDSRIDGSLKSRLQTIGAALQRTRLASESYYED